MAGCLKCRHYDPKGNVRKHEVRAALYLSWDRPQKGPSGLSPPGLQAGLCLPTRLRGRSQMHGDREVPAVDRIGREQ